MFISIENLNLVWVFLQKKRGSQNGLEFAAFLAFAFSLALSFAWYMQQNVLTKVSIIEIYLSLI